MDPAQTNSFPMQARNDGRDHGCRCSSNHQRIETQLQAVQLYECIRCCTSCKKSSHMVVQPSLIMRPMLPQTSGLGYYCIYNLLIGGPCHGIPSFHCDPSVTRGFIQFLLRQLFWVQCMSHLAFQHGPQGEHVRTMSRLSLRGNWLLTGIRNIEGASRSTTILCTIFFQSALAWLLAGSRGTFSYQ
jgi:hypothetical protein